MIKVVITATAEMDLLDIRDFIRRHNPVRAQSFVDELMDRCLSLGDMPRAYPLVPRQEASGIRRYVHGNYLIFYRVMEDLVEVVHVLHGARHYESVLFPQDGEI